MGLLGRARVAALALVCLTPAALGSPRGAPARAASATPRAAEADGQGNEKGEAKGDEQSEAQIERFLTLARTGSPVIRPQAAQRLLALGAPAAERLLAVCGAGPEAMAELGPELVSILPAFADARLRAASWRALAESDFPWRPAAAGGLAKSSFATAAPERSAEAARFQELLEDPIVQVRRAAIEGLAGLDWRAAREAIRGRLTDERGEVRARAAALLASWGEASAAWTLYAELERADRFFSMPIGRSARNEAWKWLAPLLAPAPEYDPEPEPADNGPALARVRAALEALAGPGPQAGDSQAARAGAPSDAAETGLAAAGPGLERETLLGIELRSCRRGEFFLRWTSSDELLIGLGEPLVVPLAPGSVARLEALGRASLAALGALRFWGAPGCDIERIHLARAGGGSEVWLVSKGPAAVSGLRPAELDPFLNALLASVPVTGADPRCVDLRARVRAAFEAIGGALDDEPER